MVGVSSYLNGIAATTRAFIEQFMLWTAATKAEVGNDSAAFEELLQVMIKGKMHQEFARQKHPDNWSKSLTREKLELIFKAKLTNRTIEIEQHVDFFNAKLDEINDILNEFVHAARRFYDLDAYNMHLTKLNDWQEIVASLIQNVDFTKFDKINTKLKNLIDKAWSERNEPGS